MEFLVSVKVFETVEVGFLPIGHTHEDIDQCFSQTSGRLRQHTAVTLEDLHHQLSFTNQCRTKVSHMKRIVNWKGLCDLEHCIRKISNITQYRYFKFTRAFSEEDSMNNTPVSTMCHVRSSCYDNWKELYVGKNGDGQKGLLKKCPDIRKTPPLVISCSDSVDDITKRFVSEEGRINDTNKLMQLYELRDFVFTNRTDKFHWDLTNSAETSHCAELQSADSEADNQDHGVDEIAPKVPPNSGGNTEVEQTVLGNSESVQKWNVAAASTVATETPISKVTYNLGSFVAVQASEPNEGGESKFWIGKVTEKTYQPGQNYVSKIKVHWYDNKENQTPLQGQYYPCYKTGKKYSKAQARSVRRKIQIPYNDMVDTDAVIVTFDNLTKRNRLPLAVQKKLSN